MKTLEEEKKKKPKGHKRLGFYIVGLAICLMTIIALIKFGTLLFLLPIWSWISHSMVNATGMNIWLAKTLSALLILPLIYIGSLVFSWQKKKRKVGIILLSACTAIICFSMFFISKDTYFSFKSGQATKWYIVTPQGEYKFSASPGFDPICGKKYEIVTPKVVEDYVLQKQGADYSALPKEQYFDTRTGKPVKWYAVLPDSSIEIFSNPGVHPKYGMELKPVTREIVEQMEKGKLELAQVKAERERQRALEEKRKTEEELNRLTDSVKTAQREPGLMKTHEIKLDVKKEVRSGGKPYLGISYKHVDEMSIKLPIDYGVVVLPNPSLGKPAVEPDSPADKAGIKEGDIILELNGVKLSKGYDFDGEISKFFPGDKIKLYLLRFPEATKNLLIVELGSTIN